MRSTGKWGFLHLSPFLVWPRSSESIGDAPTGLCSVTGLALRVLYVIVALAVFHLSKSISFHIVIAQVL